MHFEPEPVHPLIPQVVRIALRYISGLVGGGSIAVLLQEPQTEALVTAAVAALIGLASEWWFARDRASGKA